MAWQTVLEPGIAWKPKAKGESVEGVFEGIELVEHENLERPFEQYSLRDPETNSVLYVRQSYQLKEAFSKITIGQYVRVTYLDTLELASGRNMNTYRVETRDNI